MRRLISGILLSAYFFSPSFAVAGGEISVPKGSYLPFFAFRNKDAKVDTRPPTEVAAFRIDTYPITNSEFLEFVRANSEWRKSAVKRVFADDHYLAQWPTNLSFAKGLAKSPVTSVSWFAAEAYCEWKGKSLPTTDQWEYAASESGKDAEKMKEKILAWYERPTKAKIPPVGSGSVNRFGIHDLFGLVWEWTLDFNGLIQSAEARESGSKDTNQFCGSGSLGALDPTDYASFMRYSFRNSLKANFTVASLGFRCAREAP
ncbi:MAG: formylglycine-generating enzyme family protein [Bdellovibrionales bacterium]|nr:formylglycine-generating enzyme family protein [Bdellovibrionales bacterium]